ncbi:hypothetical protein HZU77_010055 [Neisseriaceae bacterium TC5R-5]|nr:hypothetical protein [Neisseriaceae bacterium TC5R-5]
MKKVLIGLLSLMAPFATATAFELSCPESIALDHQSVKLLSPDRPPWQFKVHEQSQYWSEGMHLFDGRPEELMELKPEQHGDKQVWDLQTLVSANGAWVACQYAGTPARYVQKLPEPLQQCSVSLGKDGRQQALICQ